MAADTRRIEFGAKPARAVHLKLTQPLFEALCAARASGEAVTMDLGAANVICVGAQQFRFQAHAASLQDVLRLPADAGQPAAEVARISHRLHVQRVMTDAERQRVRQRGQEAEELRRGRTAQVLAAAPKPSKGRRVVSKTGAPAAMPPGAQRLPQGRSPQRGGAAPLPPRQLTPPPGGRARTPPPQPAAKRTPPPIRTATPPPSGSRSQTPVANGRLTPPPGGLKGKPGPSRLGGGGSKTKRPPSGGGGSAQPLVAAPALAVETACRGLGLRKVLVACVGTDRPKKPKLDQMLADVARRVPGFKAGREEATRLLREVADFRAPGVYVLTEYAARRELGPLQRELGSPPQSGAPSPTPFADVGPASQPAPQPAAGVRTRSPSPSPAPAASAPSPPDSAAAEPLPRPAAKKQRREKRAAAAEPSGEPVAASAARTPQRQTPSADTGSPAVEEAVRADWWFAEFVRPPRAVPPLPPAAKPQFDALFDRHDAMYDAYTRLGQAIAAFKSEYLARSAAAKRAGGGPDAVAAAEAAAQAFYAQRIGEVRAMHTAFQTLHAELEGVKAALAAFCAAHGAAGQD